MSQLREIAAPFVANPTTGVCIRTRLKGLTDRDEEVLRQVGTHLGRLASTDLSARGGLVWATTRMAGPPGNAT